MNDLTEGNEAKSIFLFSLPMLIGSLFQQLYNTADSIIVGQFIGTDAMAAVSGSSPIVFLLTSLLIGITLGFSILISQYYGSKNMEKVKASIDTTYIFIFITSTIITFLGILFSKKILQLMNTPQTILEQSTLYLRIIFLGTIFSVGYNSVTSILRGLGDSKTPLYFLITATVLNIILDVVFIIVFKMGVEGVALATIIAQAVAFISSIIYLNRAHAVFKIKINQLKYDHEIFKIGLKLGIPSGIQQMLFSVGNITLQSLVNGFGTFAMAAFGAGSKIENFISLPLMNLGAATSTFVAQNMGAGKVDRAERGVKASMKMSISMAVFVCIILIIFKANLISIFNSNEDVIKIGSDYLMTLGPFFIFIATSFILTSAIRGAGDSVFALISSMISLWLARIPTAYVLSKLVGVNGIWMGIPIGWFVGLIVTGTYYKKGHWKTKCVIKKSVNDFSLEPEIASDSTK